MSLLKSLFNETSDHGVAKKHLKRISRRYPELEGFEEVIPSLNYPKQGTSDFEDDISEVRRCLSDKSLSDVFLKSSNTSVESVFKKYLKDNNLDFNWDVADRLVEDLDTVILRLKYSYNRQRPKEYFSSNGEANLDIVDATSPSFPSGHTAIAFLLSSIISDKFPDHRMTLQTLSEMIGQSRLENGAHFPSDIVIGRFLGEAAFDFYLIKSKDSPSIKDSHKNLRLEFENTAMNSRSTVECEKAISLFCNDLGEFLNDCTRANEKECHECANDYMAGLSPEFATNDISVKRILDFLAEVNLLKDDDYLGIVSCQKILEDSSSVVFRNQKKNSKLGVSHPDPENILPMIKKCFEIDQRPYIKFLLINFIKPFSNGNKRFSKAILAKDLEYNFDIVNQLLDRDIDTEVSLLCESYDINILLSS